MHRPRHLPQQPSAEAIVAKFKDITGQRFGKLVAVKRVHPNNANNHVRWLCRCDCGREHITTGLDLRSGKVASCKCAHPVWRHGHSEEFRKDHLYTTWKNMRNRCNDPNSKQYKDYGGRGIKVCERWNDYGVFMNDIFLSIGERPPGLTIDRINNDGNYEPNNIRWATRSQQRLNSRLPGQKKTITRDPILLRNSQPARC
jgi:hypothetical protein